MREHSQVRIGNTLLATQTLHIPYTLHQTLYFSCHFFMFNTLNRPLNLGQRTILRDLVERVGRFIDRFRQKVGDLGGDSWKFIIGSL